VAERIRFHLDEHMDPDIAAALRRHGIDVTTTVEVGLRSANDDSQFEYAESQNVESWNRCFVVATERKIRITRPSQTAE
jgi:hypothetical protein